MFSSKSLHQDPVTPLSGQSLLHSIDPWCCCLTSLLYHTIHSVLIIITPKRRPPSACRILCKFQSFLTLFINTTCSDIDCYVLSVLTSHLSGHTVWNQLSSLLLGGLDRLLRRLTALTGGAEVDFDKVLISLSLWMEESHKLCKINSWTPHEPNR